MVGLPDERSWARSPRRPCGCRGRHLDADDLEGGPPERLADYKVPEAWLVVDDLPAPAPTRSEEGAPLA